MGVSRDTFRRAARRDPDQPDITVRVGPAARRVDGGGHDYAVAEPVAVVVRWRRGGRSGYSGRSGVRVSTVAGSSNSWRSTVSTNSQPQCW